jgi:mono/diheme cytochrome c family protein
MTTANKFAAREISRSDRRADFDGTQELPHEYGTNRSHALALQLPLAAYRQFQGSTRAQTDRCEMTKIEHRTQYAVAMIATMALLVTVACSGAATGIVADAVGPDGLTSFQREHGVGPLTKPVDVSASVDKTLAASGAKLFEQKCSACHKMDERYVGPPLGDVTKRRTPTFVMNMILNPQEMVLKHPASKKLLAEFMVPMPNLNLSTGEAREVVEYLRSQQP